MNKKEKKQKKKKVFHQLIAVRQLYRKELDPKRKKKLKAKWIELLRENKLLRY